MSVFKAYVTKRQAYSKMIKTQNNTKTVAMLLLYYEKGYAILAGTYAFKEYV